jgi:hypothetical protein
LTETSSSKFASFQLSSAKEAGMTIIVYYGTANKYQFPFQTQNVSLCVITHSQSSSQFIHYYPSNISSFTYTFLKTLQNYPLRASFVVD